MQTITDTLELNYNSVEAQESFSQAMMGLPPSVDTYLVGGALRNALFRMFHGTRLIQRDYDQVITRGSSEYGEYITSLDFEALPYPSNQDRQIVFRKALNKQAKQGDSYTNWLVIDMNTVDGSNIEENIKNNACFTVNCCAIKCNDIFSIPWQEALVEVLPTALQDIKDKKLRVNRDGYKYGPSNFYSMLRLMSAGFSAPSSEEVGLLLHELPNLEHARFERNVKKAWDYVGGEHKARDLVKSLGIDIDVFNEGTVKSKL